MGDSPITPDLAELLSQISLRDKQQQTRISELEAELDDLKNSMAIIVYENLKTQDETDLEPLPIKEEGATTPQSDKKPKRKNKCSVCKTITDPPHNKTTCPLKKMLANKLAELV